MDSNLRLRTLYGKKRNDYLEDAGLQVNSDVLPSRRIGEGYVTDDAAPQLDIPNISRAGIAPDEPASKFRALYDEVNASYKPETRDTEAYRQLRESFPQREDASVGRKIAAAGAYLGNVRRHIPGGQDAADKVLDGSFNRDLADWKEKAGPAYNAANLERQENIQNRTLLSNALTSDRYYNQLEETRRANQAKEKTNDFNAESRRIRDNAYAFAQNNWKINSNGVNIIATRTNPQTGKPESVDLGKTGNVSREDLVLIQGGFLLRREAMREESDAADTAQRNSVRYRDKTTGHIYEFNSRTKIFKGVTPGAPDITNPQDLVPVDETPPNPAVPKVLTPAQMEGQKQEKYNQYWAANPEDRRFFTSPDRSGNVKLRRRDSIDTSWAPWTTASDTTEQAAYDKVYEALEGNPAGRGAAPKIGDRVGTPPGAGRGAAPAAGRGAAPQIPKGAKPGGTWTTTRSGKQVYVEP